MGLKKSTVQTKAQNLLNAKIPTSVLVDTNNSDVFKYLTEVVNTGPFSSNPQYYLNLVNVGPNDNYSTYTNPTRSPWGTTDSSIKTIWTKIAVDPVTLIANTGDFRFATSTGKVSHWPAYSTQVPFGTAFGCQSPGTADGIAHIDLRGTNFAINDNFAYGGSSPKGTITLSNNNQVASITGGGYCGWCGPATADAAGEQNMHSGGWDLQLVLINTDVFVAPNGLTYLNLTGNNVSGYTNPTRKPWGANNSSIKTVWTKVRFDPVAMVIDTSDYTYSTSTGEVDHWPLYNKQVPFGTAFGCQNPSTADGIANIDLTGTKYAVNDTFSNGGYLPAGTATFSSNGQVIAITGGGYCGWEGPSKAVAQGEQHMHIGGKDIQLKLM